MTRIVSKRLIKGGCWKLLLNFFLLFSFVNLVGAVDMIIDNLDNDSSIEDEAGAADAKWQDCDWGSNYIHPHADTTAGHYNSNPAGVRVECHNVQTQDWQSFTVEKLYTGNSNVYDFSGNSILSVYVSFSGDAGQADKLEILAKIEDSADPPNQSDDLGFPVVNKGAGWTKLTWNYEGKTGGVDLTKIEKIRFFPRPIKGGSLMQWWWGDFYMDDLTIEGGAPGPPTGGITVNIVDWDGNPAAENKIIWDSASIIPGTTKWLCAETLLKVECDYTGGGAIQIYTDNKESDANPQWNGTGDPKNLLRYEAGVSTSTAGIPMCWRTPYGILPSTGTYIYDVEKTEEPDIGTWHLTDIEGSQYFCWIRMIDGGADEFDEGNTYQTIWRKNDGCQHAEYTFDTNCSLQYVYIGANFIDAMAQKTYKTSTLRLELYTE